ncbi:MAG: MarR family transcriptional regulator [bacterium]|nr:MarR family transcriptional regulator [bacterium]
MQNNHISKITTYQAGTVQAYVNRLLQKQCDEILAPFGISKMQWMIIGNILDAGKNGIRVSDLVDILGTTMPYLTTNINLLQSKGYLQRLENLEDSRSKLISINPSFVKQCHKMETALREGLRTSIYAKIDPEEFQTYIKVMYQLKSVE